MLKPPSHVRIQSGTKALAAAERSSASIAVDLGFSKSKASCGLAWQSGSETSSRSFGFGACVAKVADLVAGTFVANLIIEAPLSGFFSIEGNPIERGSFERIEATDSARARTRYWYSGPGAATCLGALFFLGALLARLNTERHGELRITLFEGFLTFKASATDHARDANLLLQAFLDGHNDELLDPGLPDGATVISIIDVVAPGSEKTTPPTIVLPSRRRIEAG